MDEDCKIAVISGPFFLAYKIYRVVAVLLSFLKI